MDNYLLISLLTGVPLVTEIIQFVVLSIIANCITLMTFYPAVISLTVRVSFEIV